MSSKHPEKRLSYRSVLPCEVWPISPTLFWLRTEREWTRITLIGLTTLADHFQFPQMRREKHDPPCSMWLVEDKDQGSSRNTRKTQSSPRSHLATREDAQANVRTRTEFPRWAGSRRQPRYRVSRSPPSFHVFRGRKFHVPSPLANVLERVIVAPSIESLCRRVLP